MDFPLITEDTVFDAVILGNGNFPTHSVPLGILHNARYICCCDGAGIELIENHGIIPQAIVGDGDSMTQDFKKKYHDIIHIVDEQEDNDQTKATRHCMAQGFKRIAYIGSTGKREDHTLGNISLLIRYATEMNLDVTMITDNGYFIVTDGCKKIQTFSRQQVSIFNISCSIIDSEGLKWQTYPYKNMWQGTLNEALEGDITMKADGIYMIFRTFLQKNANS